MNVVKGMLSICNRDGKVLFDPGSMHSYLSPAFSKYIDVDASDLQFVLTGTTPVGKQEPLNTCPL